MDRLDTMALFARVVETGSFSRAAEGLALTQPTASKCIAALERRLGVRLLERSTRRLRPTDAGLDFYERCRRLLAEADEVESSVRAGARAAVGRIRVAAPMGFGRMHVVPVVNRFLAAHPEASIDLVMNDRFVDLVEEGVDLSIRIANRDDPLLPARALGETPRVLVASPAYLAAHGLPASPADLARHRFVVYAYFEAPELIPLSGPAGDETLRVEPCLRVNNAEAMRAAALAGIGIAPLPVWCVADELAHDALRVVLPEWRLPTSRVYAAYSSARYLPARVRLFIDFLAAELRIPAWP